eukprot:785275-Amphidinium_carterae.1
MTNFKENHMIPCNNRIRHAKVKAFASRVLSSACCADKRLKPELHSHQDKFVREGPTKLSASIDVHII